MAKSATADKTGFTAKRAMRSMTAARHWTWAGRSPRKALWFGREHDRWAGWRRTGHQAHQSRRQRGEIKALRAEELEGAGDQAAFVRYGHESNAKVDLGVKVPVGVGYVDTGFKRGSKLRGGVDSPRGQPQARLEALDVDLSIPGDGDALLAMKAGESFAVKGSTSHAVRGGAGLGTSVGASSVGDIGLRAGGKMTYALSGETRTEVARSGTTALAWWSRLLT